MVLYVLIVTTTSHNLQRLVFLDKPGSPYPKLLMQKKTTLRSSCENGSDAHDPKTNLTVIIHIVAKIVLYPWSNNPVSVSMEVPNTFKSTE